jgi:hypothetical protein
LAGQIGKFIEETNEVLKITSEHVGVLPHRTRTAFRGTTVRWQPYA